LSRRRVARAVGLALLAIGSAPAAAGARTPSPCQRLQGPDLAPARFVKLVERRDGALVGCVLPRGPLRRVATNGRAGDVDNRSYVIRQVAGRIVLVETSSMNDEASSTATEVHDLRSGRSFTIGQRCTVKAAFPCSIDSVDSVAAAFATPAGRAVAVVVDDGWGTTGASVLAFTTLGTRRVLDSGDAGAIVPASLRLIGNLAFWTNAGAPRSASLTAG